MFLKVTLGDVLFSLVAIAIVFLVLALLVIIVSLMSKINFEGKKKAEVAAPVAQPVAPQKKFSAEDIKDEDMMVAALVATVDFIEETKKTDARVVSIKQIG
jgi:Na+-transporting methylmalonyl-CoA/oxaloacetate decarboxylase gamma subunit